MSDPSTNNCNLLGHCGFILRVKAATGNNDDSFDIKLVTDQDVYDGDIHFHKNSLQPEYMHFTLDITITKEKRTGALTNVPVSWHDRPRRDGTGKYWYWGNFKFYLEDEGVCPADDTYKVNLFMGSKLRIRPVVFY